MPHARVRSIDASAALAMPGVKAILTADDLPAPADSINDNGTVILANPRGYQALTNEPLFQGEPILAVAAVDELTAAEAIEKIKIDLEPLPFVVDPLVSLRPGGPNARTDGNVWVRVPPPPPKPGERPAVTPPELHTLKWTEEDFDEAKEGRLPMGKATEEWHVGDVEAGLQERGAGPRRNVRHAEHQPPVPGDSHHDGVLAERQGLRSHRHAEHGADRSRDRAMAGHRRQQRRIYQ